MSNQTKRISAGVAGLGVIDTAGSLLAFGYNFVEERRAALSMDIAAATHYDTQAETAAVFGIAGLVTLIGGVAVNLCSKRYPQLADNS